MQTAETTSRAASFFPSARAFTLIEIMIVVAILSLLAVLAIPNAIRARDTAARNSCISNLRALTGAKEQWSFEQRKGPDATPDPADIFGANKYIRLEPQCPSGGNYSLNAMRDKPTCPNDVELSHVLSD